MHGLKAWNFDTEVYNIIALEQANGNRCHMGSSVTPAKVTASSAHQLLRLRLMQLSVPGRRVGWYNLRRWGRGKPQPMPLVGAVKTVI